MLLYLCLLVMVECEAYQNSWGPEYRYRTPQEAMVDVVNELALRLLAIHNEGNENNIAISPYGAVSVLVALTEGVRGEAQYEITRAANIPTDLSTIRIGLRDIHRHLKSYFIPEEGFLSGLTLSHENVTLNREYEDILRFYGYDINSFNSALYPEFFTSSEKPETTTETATSTEETTTTVPEVFTSGTTTAEEVTEKDRITRAETTPLADRIFIGSTTETISTTQTETSSISTTIKDTESSTTQTEISSISTTIKDTETSTTTQTETSSIGTTIRDTETSSVSTSTQTETGSASTTIEVTEPKTESTTKITGTTSELSTTMKEYDVTENNIDTETVGTIIAEERQDVGVSTVTVQSSTLGSDLVEFIDDIKNVTEEMLKIEETTNAESTTDAEKTTEYSDEENNRPLNRSTRSVVDYVIARYYDDHYVTQRPPPYNLQEDLYFLINGKYKESNINYMTYDTVLPFHYIPHLNTLALRFPLDSSKYYLLLLLPEDVRDVNKLICDLRMNTSLKYIINNLRFTHVKAVIPSFMLKGIVVLTSTFQKMGINKVFEPRHADFSPMTEDRNIYVTNIEQAITVTIRNYVDPVTMNANRYLHQNNPVLFKADHPFLYFVIDSEIDVTLMAGKIVNPLNSRIR